MGEEGAPAVDRPGALPGTGGRCLREELGLQSTFGGAGPRGGEL
jgi:hypothetical protein